jgi:hypothetical protein
MTYGWKLKIVYVTSLNLNLGHGGWELAGWLDEWQHHMA